MCLESFFSHVLFVLIFFSQADYYVKGIRFELQIIHNLHEGQQIHGLFRFFGTCIRTTPLLLLLIPCMFLVTCS